MRVGTTLDLEDKSSTLVESARRSLVRLDTEQPRTARSAHNGYSSWRLGGVPVQQHKAEVFSRIATKMFLTADPKAI